jgi:hypothetical protein
MTRDAALLDFALISDPGTARGLSHGALEEFHKTLHPPHTFLSYIKFFTVNLNSHKGYNYQDVVNINF